VRTPLLACSILLLAAANTPSRASGLALRWDACVRGDGVANASFACDMNTGSSSLFASFAIPYDLSYLPHGYESVIDVATAGTELSPWWSMACRGTSMTFTDRLPSPCGAITGGEAILSVAWFISPRGPNAARFVVSSTLVNPPRFGFVIHEIEYGIVGLVVDHAKTVGPDACGGCLTPACIVFNSLKIFSSVQGVPPDLTLNTAGFGAGSNAVTWQGGAGVQVGPAIGCPAATAARRSAWGQVKALYR